MKKEQLQALGLSEEQIKEVFKENGKDIAALKESNDVLSNEKKEIEEKLEAAGKTIEDFKKMDVEGVKKAADEWKQKYETEKESWEKEKTDKMYTEAIQAHLGEVEFTSSLAKEAVVGKIKASNLTLQDGKLMGFDDMLKGIKESDAGAFSPAKQNESVKVNLGGSLAGGGSLNSETFFSAFQVAAGVKTTE